MKHLIIFSLILSTSLIFANETNQNSNIFKNYLNETIESVENARKDALDALDEMVINIDIEKSMQPETEHSISTQIIETQARTQIAKNTANIEIAKAKAITEITRAIDNIDKAEEKDRKKVEDASLTTIIKAVASVEIAKANASKGILEATQKIEISKANNPKIIKDKKETLSIANCVADAQLAKAKSVIEIARSSIADIIPKICKEDKVKLEKMKAEAKAKISSYLTQIEAFKEEVLAKIKQEITKVESAQKKIETPEPKNTTYPTKLIKID